jgi:steroid 5-alpha reductase family enzyme
MRERVVWVVSVLICLGALVANPATRAFALWNVLVQAAIFVPSACVPAWRTNRMSYVDFAWPAGILALGIQGFVFAEELTPLTIAAATMFTVAGARLMYWGYLVVKPGWLKEEFPRYQYQRLVWEKAGLRSERLSLQYEISVQATANMSYFALPSIIIATNPRGGLHPVEIAAIAVWIAAYVYESVADVQKGRFLGGYASDSRDVCDTGLWRYSRHPNYFGQWVQWCAAVLLAVPSVMALWERSPVVPWVISSVGLLFLVRAIYQVMVFYSGAVPAEHYSVLKRPGYRRYQAEVNRFFPGPRKPASVDPSDVLEEEPAVLPHGADDRLGRLPG